MAFSTFFAVPVLSLNSNYSSSKTSCMALVTFLIMFSILFIKNTPFKSYITLKRGVSCIFSLFISA
nr:MAG TPA: hypothetical protein [Caudoviricetes sp.]